MDSTEFPLLLKSPCLFLLLVGISLAGLLWFSYAARIRDSKKALLKALHRDGECELHPIGEEINPIFGTDDAWLDQHVLQGLVRAGLVEKTSYWVQATGRTHEVYHLTDQGRRLTEQMFGTPPHG